MPLDPSLEELSDQQAQAPPQGLPPPQPAPYGVASAMEHQQRWGMPGISEQLGDIANKMLVKPAEWAGERAYTAMHGGVGEESVRATDDLLASFFGIGSITGAERGALGALRMSRMVPGEKRIAVHNFGGKDEWNLHSKETGNKLGEMYTNYNKKTNQLTVEYMTGQWPGYFDTSVAEQRSWGIGTHELQTLGPEVLLEYPNIDTLKFTRIGGVFKGNPTTLIYKRVDTPEGVTFERIKSRRGGGSGWVPPAQRNQPGRPTAQPPSAQRPNPFAQQPLEPEPQEPQPPSTQQHQLEDAAWNAYFNSIGRASPEETTRLFNEYIRLTTPRT